MKVFIETFGCQMNELDSELVQGQLQSLGYQLVDEPANATIVLYNTCSVREQAEQKACSRIGVIGMRKRQGERILLGVIGCMAERDGAALFRKYPQIDLLCGPGELDRLPGLIDSARKAQEAQAGLLTEGSSLAERTALAGNRNRRTATLAAAQDNLEALDLGRAFSPGAAGRRAYSAYVRITRGCNKFCTYCVVPNTRGAEIHRPPDHIVDECKRLVDSGVIEITLLGQTVNHYRYQHGLALTVEGLEAPQVGPGLSAFRSSQSAAGVASNTRTTSFADLLRRVHEEVPGLARLRFVTSYPRDFGDDILQVMRDSPRICRYLHAPLQSGSDRILKAMNRGYTTSEYIEFVERASTMLPDLCLAGDIIVGFPGETQADFEATCSLVERLPFKNNFIFKYSPRPGTTAFDRLKDDVSDADKRLRNNQLLALQSKVSQREHTKWIGKRCDVLFDETRVIARRKSNRHLAVSSSAPTHAFQKVSISAGVSVRGETSATPTGPDNSPPIIQCVGRTNGDLIVAVECNNQQFSDALIGNIGSVHCVGAEPLTLLGNLAAE